MYFHCVWQDELGQQRIPKPSKSLLSNPLHHTPLLGLPSLQKCVCEILGEIWFGVRFEI